MPAFNIVRFRVKPGQAEDFIEAYRKLQHLLFRGFTGGWLVKTGDDTFCMVGQWKVFQNIVNRAARDDQDARPDARDARGPRRRSGRHRSSIGKHRGQARCCQAGKEAQSGDSQGEAGEEKSFHRAKVEARKETRSEKRQARTGAEEARKLNLTPLAA
jgi:hypothetical protein